jgi:protein-S-isoprenylcysteine O-methyltransferase Ste14
MTSVRIIWLLIALLWVIGEIRLVRKVASKKQHVIDSEQRSQGWLWLSVIGSLSLGLFFKNMAWLPIPIEYMTRQWLALVLCATGLGLRYWAVVRLGRFFSTHVLIHNQHQLITDGPYKWIRHPAYTGLLLALAGAGLAMGDFLALLLLTVMPFFAFKLRIAMEEKKLIKQFGQQYLVYLNKTYRLLPLLY